MDEPSREFKDHTYALLAKIGKAIASPKRLELLNLLCQSPKTVETLSKVTQMSVANTSQHLQTLLESRMVEFKKQGLYSYYQVTNKTVVHFILSLQFLAENSMAEMKRLRDDLYFKKDNMEKITINELIDKMKNGNVILIDVRPKDEYEVLHIPGADSIPVEELEAHMSTLPKSKEIVAYCRGKCCLLSVTAVEFLTAHGFKALRLEESVQEWYSLIDKERFVES